MSLSYVREPLAEELGRFTGTPSHLLSPNPTRLLEGKKHEIIVHPTSKKASPEKRLSNR
jgi:hypothetical protein